MTRSRTNRFAGALATAPLLAVALLAAGARGAEFPRTALSNGVIAVDLWLPGGTNAYYRALRFDTASAVLQVTRDGYTFLGKLRTGPHNPLANDGLGGIPEEFDKDDPPGFSNAAPGQSFLKIGVGRLRKPADGAPYRFARSYEVVEAFPWRVEDVPGGLRFVQEGHDPAGYGYRYERTVRLLPGEPALRLERRLTNTGTQRLATTHYLHTFVRLGGRDIGDGYRVGFDWPATGAVRRATQAAWQDGVVRLLEPRLKGAFWMEVGGLGSRSNATVTVRCDDGASVRCTTDRPLATFCIYAEAPALSPEPFVRLDLAPGESADWTTTFEFQSPVAPAN